jgi:acetyl-CoA carboxylase carboxyltransferase component
MDLVVMPRRGAFMFLTGPDVVREVTGEDVNVEQLGGAGVAERSGLASLVGLDEDHALEQTRVALSLLPDRVGDPAPRAFEWTSPSGDPSEVVPDDPRVAYDVRAVLDRVVDDASFLELRRGSAKNMVVGWARLEGSVVGIVANQPHTLAGAIDTEASRKGAWFVQLCDRFGIPLAVFVDTPGFLPGTAQELGGVIPAGASFLSAFVSARVPKATVVMRKAYGGAYIVMNARDLGADYAFAWPSAEIAVLGAPGAVRILERRRITEADDPSQLRAELEQEYREQYCTPWPAARDGYIDEVIEPSATRTRLALAITSR